MSDSTGPPADAAVAAFARPTLPTPVAIPVVVDIGAGAADTGPRVRWRRRETDGGRHHAPGVDVLAAPPGWRPTAGSTAALPGEPPVWLVGAGDGTAKDWRAVGAAAVRATRDLIGDHDTTTDDGAEPAPGAAAPRRPDDAAAPRPRDAVATLHVGPERSADAPGDSDGWAALATGIVLGSHRFSLRTSTPAPVPPLVLLPVPAQHRDAVARAVELARATAIARDLADTPSGVKSPQWFARTAADLATADLATGDGDGSGLRVTIHDDGWLTEHRFGGVLAVGGGSSRLPRLLELAWEGAGPAKTSRPHVVLVGKGITFDTGGISIKPNAGMADMRTDCAGGAAVVGALRTIARLGLPVRVTGLVPLAENHVSGSAYRPGDVVRHRGGITSEVTNTDAEGRMVLADALAHAGETLEPDVVVDVATLTGAMKVALGVRTGGVFATSEALAERVVDAGAAAGEAWWPMPLTDHLVDDVTSDIADVRQAPPGPGGIVAALFLRRFTAGRPWAHLDIAGPARCDTPHEEVAQGATGFAARTLVEFCARWPSAS